MEVQDSVDEKAANQAVATLREQAQEKADQYLKAGAGNGQQALLLAALELFLQHWPNHEVAESVEIDFGLLPILSDLGPKQSLILEGGCPDKFQLEVKRLTEQRPTGKALLCLWCPLPPPGRCCLKVLSPM